MRKNPLVNGETYHIFTRSIADFHIFNNESEFQRMVQLLRYYRKEIELKFSHFLELKNTQKQGFNSAFEVISKDKNHSVEIIAYCLMPTHPHLILKQLNDNGISKYLSNVLNGYTRYFNIKHKRKGPLWESEFKSVLIENDEQLLHLTRYIHLNPVTANLIKRPEEWDYSSYKEYISDNNNTIKICDFDEVLEIDSDRYGRFVHDRISYQKELSKIKKLIMD